MKKQILSLYLLLTLVSAFSLDLTLEDSIEMALKENLSLKGQYVGLNSQRRASRSGWNKFLPNIEAGVGFTHTELLEELGAESPWNLSANVNLGLDFSSATVSKIKSAVLIYESGLISIDMAESLLEREVREQFSRILLSEKKVQLQKEKIETATRLYERANLNYEIGNSAYIDVLSYQVSMENMKPDLLTYENNYETAKLDFKNILGLDLTVDINLLGELSPPGKSVNGQTLVESYLFENFEIKNLQKSLEILDSEKKELVGNHWTPRLGVGYEYKPFLNDPFSGSSSSSWNDSPSEFGVTLNLHLDGYIPNSEKNLIIKEKKDRISQTELELEDKIQYTIMKIEISSMDLNKSLRTLDALNLNVQLAQENYNLIEKAYYEGVVDYLAVDKAKDELNWASFEVLDETFRYEVSLLNLEYLVNTRLFE